MALLYSGDNTMVKRMKSHEIYFNEKNLEAKKFKGKEEKTLTDKDIKELVILIAKKLNLI